MKNFYLIFISVITLFGATNNASAQLLLYEDFSYPLPAYIGGNGDAGTSSNNWTTHSITAGQTTTIDLVSGNLSYPGLQSPSGNMLYLFSNANAVSRDVNRAIITTSTVCYYSALINVIDNSQLSTTYNYFMALGGTSGTTVTLLGGRLGIVSSNSGANFRLGVGNTSGGTVTYTEYAQDLNFGTTYLVVMKYDISTSPTTASLWVNPSSLGSSEPTGALTNNVGTTAFTTLASMCLRNASTTPKVNIDEIRVGVTYADVTPLPTDVKETVSDAGMTIYPNPVSDILQINSGAEIVQITITDVLGNIVKLSNESDLSSKQIDVSTLKKGLYSLSCVLKDGRVFSTKFVK